MAVQRDIRIEGRPSDGRAAPREPIDGRFAPTGNGVEPPLSELFRQLTDDATRLIRQEVALGKAELRETGQALAKDAAKLAVAAGLGLLGAMAATAFLIIGLGVLLANFWLAALIVTVVYLGIAAFLGKQAIDDLKRRELKPAETLETLRADAEWAKREADVIKREWSS